jgi:hypothetical protein
MQRIFGLAVPCLRRNLCPQQCGHCVQSEECRWKSRQANKDGFSGAVSPDICVHSAARSLLQQIESASNELAALNPREQILR